MTEKGEQRVKCMPPHLGIHLAQNKHDPYREHAIWEGINSKSI